MKRKLILILLIACLAMVFSACGSDDAGQPQNTGDPDNIQIVATIFPEYDWVQNILGDNPAKAEVTLLLDSGVDLHSFQPTSEDMMKIATCDLFIYVGGESDRWVEDALSESVNENVRSINLLQILGDQAKEEEVIEGMEAEEESDEAGDEEGPELDEHVWLSLQNASLLCGAIEEAIAEIDPDNASVYEGNLKDYQAQLKELDHQYKDVTDLAKVKTLLFADRFPFRYLTDEYGLDYYAAFTGCSAESEASFETIQFLAKKMDELGLSCVMTIENSDQKIAQTVIRTTKAKDQKILAMNSMQAVTAGDVQAGASYLDIMGNNLTVLKEALQ
ncbi:MAG: zinc ABC transporter substrate-binding protein [Firmicutes bacterium]|nr:zinc ABC transporter substrate-binding protein [Bacillota bacterium]MBQ9016556.1 zinc ABC transporter substrate-binding protein [Bacillota bacterium]